MIYLDNAATSFPKPDSVLRAVCGTMRRQAANPGRSGHRMSLAAGRIIVGCREIIATLLDVPSPDQVIFCFNCTDAINLALRGLLRAGDHVITTALDHNAMLRPLHGMQARGLITLTVLFPGDSGTVTASDVLGAIKPNTRLVAMTHASNVTGAIQPVAQVGAALSPLGIPLLVDAAQTIGILPVHPLEMGASLVAFPGHKALFGPMGTGVLWIDPSLDLLSFREGGTGSRSDSVNQPDELPDRFESGTLNLPGIAGLFQGVRFVLAHQPEIALHEAMLAGRLRRGLSQLPGVYVYTPRGPSVGVVAFNVKEKHSGKIAEALDQSAIGVRSGLHCAPLCHQWLETSEIGAVRASPGFFSSEGDIDRLLSVVSRL